MKSSILPRTKSPIFDDIATSHNKLKQQLNILQDVTTGHYILSHRRSTMQKEEKIMKASDD